MMPKQYKKILFFALMAFTAAMLLNKILLVFTFKYEIAGLEPYFTYLVLKVGSGQLYSNPEQYPFIVTQYSPIYFYLVNGIAAIFEKLGGNEVRSVYVVGRGINLICVLLIAYFIYQFFIKKLKSTRWIAAIVGVLVLNLFINHNIGVRPDSLKILFITLMYMQMYYCIQHNQRKNYLLFSLFAIIALLSKQDALIPVLTSLFILFCHKKFLQSIVYGLGIGAITAVVILGLCNWEFDLVLANLVGGISQGANLTWFKEIVRLNYLTFPVLIVFLLIMIYWAIRKISNKSYFIGLLVLYFSALAALFKWGSNFNYLIEFQIIGVVTLCYIGFLKNKNWVKYIVIIGVIGIYFNNFHNKNVTKPNFWVERDAYKLFKEDIKVSKEIDKIYLDADASIISFSLHYPLFLNDKSIQWAMVNDYPEVFLKNLESLIDELPIKVFDYNYDCAISQLRNTVFMAPTENIDWYISKLNFVFGPGEKPQDVFRLNFIEKYHGFSFYKIECQ